MYDKFSIRVFAAATILLFLLVSAGYTIAREPKLFIGSLLFGSVMAFLCYWFPKPMQYWLTFWQEHIEKTIV